MFLISDAKVRLFFQSTKLFSLNNVKRSIFFHRGVSPVQLPLISSVQGFNLNEIK
jgi:hypothetical protein